MSGDVTMSGDGARMTTPTACENRSNHHHMIEQVFKNHASVTRYLDYLDRLIFEIS